jgi:hypothetical protein
MILACLTVMCSPLHGHVGSVAVEKVRADGSAVTISARTATAEAGCPVCGAESGRTARGIRSPAGGCGAASERQEPCRGDGRRWPLLVTCGTAHSRHLGVLPLVRPGRTARSRKRGQRFVRLSDQRYASHGRTERVAPSTPVVCRVLGCHEPMLKAVPRSGRKSDELLNSAIKRPSRNEMIKTLTWAIEGDVS